MERSGHGTEPVVCCHGGPGPGLVAACRGLRVPKLILDGAEDPRPRWALDSLERALPDVTRLVLPAAGHVPWLEAPARFGPPLRAFLDATPG